MHSPLPPLPQLYWIAKFDYRGGVQVPRHTHDFYQCLYISGGQGTGEVNGEALELTTGDLLWLPPHTPHAWHIPGPRHLETLDMKFSVPETMAADLRLHQVPARTGRPDVEPMFHSLWVHGLGPARHRGIRCAYMLHAFLMQLVQPETSSMTDTSATTHPNHPVIRQLQIQLKKQPEKKWRAEDLAGLSGYSYRQLTEICKKACGKTPMGLLEDIRMAIARSHLRCSDLPVKEIADITGYESVHHFTRVFTARENLPPAAWRREQQTRLHQGKEIDPDFHNEIRVHPSGKA